MNEGLKELEDDNLELKCKVYDLEVNLNTRDAELIYWKETAEYYKKELNKILDKKNNK